MKLGNHHGDLQVGRGPLNNWPRNPERRIYQARVTGLPTTLLSSQVTPMSTQNPTSSTGANPTNGSPAPKGFRRPTRDTARRHRQSNQKPGNGTVATTPRRSK